MWARAIGGHLPTHIFPLYDEKEHDIESIDCWCNPDVVHDHGEAIIIHNAADQREQYESGERQPN